MPVVPQDDAYVLGAGDEIDLRFIALDANSPLNVSAEIISDGTVSLPLVGLVKVSGLTLSQARLWLSSLYRRELVRAELQLSLRRPRPIRVALIGEVARPGIYTLTTSEISTGEAKVSITGTPRLVDAIQKAGGVTDLANLSEVSLRRSIPGDASRFRKATVNLLSLIREGDLSQNPILFDGDAIRIPRAQENAALASEISATTLAPIDISVNVIGEVQRPGSVRLPANTPLMQAVLSAGGLADFRANKNNIRLIRINRNGSAEQLIFSFNPSLSSSLAANPPLRNGDTVVVGRSVFGKVTDGLTAIGTPLTGLVNILALIQIIRSATQTQQSLGSF